MTMIIIIVTINTISAITVKTITNEEIDSDNNQ